MPEATHTRSKVRQRASHLYKKFHNSVSHEERVIYFHYIILIVVIGIYTTIGMTYYTVLYQDVNDDATKAVAPYSWFRALYFLTITMTTVGYGDMYPTTDSSRLFTAFYILFGVCIGGTYIGLINSHIQEHSERLADLRDQEIGKKLSKIHNRKFFSRITKLIRSGFTESSKSTKSTTAGESGRRQSIQMLQMAIAESSKVNETNNSENNGDNANDDSEDENDFDENNNDVISVEDGDDGHVNIKHMLQREKSLAKIVSQDSYGLTKDEEHNILDISEAAYKKDVRRLVFRFFYDLATICVTIFIGMGIMIGLEGWSPIIAFYWAVVTIAGVGYGDFKPTNNQSRSFVIVYVIVGIVLLINSLTNIVKIPSLMRVRRKEMNIIKRFGGETHELNIDVFREIVDAELYKTYPTIKKNSNEMSKGEFVILVLSLMRKIKDKDIIFACKLFDSIDKNEDRVLNQVDIDEEIKRLELLNPNPEEQDEEPEFFLGLTHTIIDENIEQVPENVV